MLVAQPKARIVSKIIRNDDGQFVRAYFLVAQFQGQVFWKCIKTECIGGDCVVSNDKILLEGTCEVVKPEPLSIIGEAILSPYSFFDFCSVQKTRAPNLSF